MATFSAALELLKTGARVRRAGWNGKGMWLWLSPPSDVQAVVIWETLHQLPWIGMRTADGGWVPWLASQTDLLSNDWERVA